MAINFDSLADLTCTPNLPEDYYFGKLSTFTTTAAKAATDTAKAKAAVLCLYFKIPYQGFEVTQMIRIPNYNAKILTQDGREFEPISTFLNPVRAQMAQPTATLKEALRYAEQHGINLGYHRNDRGYMELKATYPQVVADDTLDNIPSEPADL